MSFWDQNKDTFKKAGKATARGIGHGGKKLGQAGYTTYKKHEATKKGEVYVPPSSDSDETKAPVADAPSIASRRPIATPSQGQLPQSGSANPTLSAFSSINLEQLNSFAPPPKRNVGTFAVPQRGETSAYGSAQIIAQPAHTPQPAASFANPTPAATFTPPAMPGSDYPAVPGVQQPTAQNLATEFSNQEPPPAYPAQTISPPMDNHMALPHASSGIPHTVPPALPSRNSAYNAPVPNDFKSHTGVLPPPPPPRSDLTNPPPQMSLATQMVLGALSSSANAFAQSYAALYAPRPGSLAKVESPHVAPGSKAGTPVMHSKVADAAAQSLVNHAQANYKSYLSAAAAGVMSSQTTTTTTALSPDANSAPRSPFPPRNPTEDPVPQFAGIDLNEKPALMARNYAWRPQAPAASSSLSIASANSLLLQKKAPPPKPKKGNLHGNPLKPALHADAPGPAPNFAEQIALMKKTTSNQKPLVPPKKFLPPKPAKKSLDIVSVVEEDRNVNPLEKRLDSSAGYHRVGGDLHSRGFDKNDARYHLNGMSDSGVIHPQSSFMVDSSSGGRRDGTMYDPLRYQNDTLEFEKLLDLVDSSLEMGTDAYDPLAGSRLGANRGSRAMDEKPKADMMIETGWFLKPTEKNMPKFFQAMNWRMRGYIEGNMRYYIVRMRVVNMNLFDIQFTFEGNRYDKATYKIRRVKYLDIPPPTDEELIEWSQRFGTRIARQAMSYTGTVVGDGECWTLAETAIREGCKGEAMDTTGYTHGFPIYTRGFSPYCQERRPDRDQIRPGDVIQYSEMHYERDGRHVIAGKPDHTSIVVGVNGLVLTLRQSNMGGDLRTQKGTFDLKKYKKGFFAVFRAVPKGTFGDFTGVITRW